MEKTTLAFVIVVLMLFNVIIVHAVLRISNELQQEVDINSRQINTLVEQHYKGDFDESNCN